MTKSNSQRAEFERRYAEDKKNGLVDFKFCTVKRPNETIESFCESANKIYTAIEKGECKKHVFTDKFKLV